jgi:c-di-AMP phosphodiesterase-like protein
MKKFFDTLSMFTLSAIFIIAVSFSNINAQSRIMEDIGGGGTAQNVDPKSDNTLLYVAAGLVVGFVIYHALFVKPKADAKSKEEGKEEEKKSLSQELQEFQNEVPVQLHLGINNNQYMYNQKQFVMGLSFRL